MEKGGRKVYIKKMNGAPENGKESSHSAHANGKNTGCNAHQGHDMVRFILL